MAHDRITHTHTQKKKKKITEKELKRKRDIFEVLISPFVYANKSKKDKPTDRQTQKGRGRVGNERKL